jgi:N-acetylneuraminate lyase
MDQILELCRLPNVCGLKYTDCDLFGLWKIRQTGAVAFNGSDEMLSAGLLMGASGGIGSIYNLVPGEFVRLYQLACQGNWQQARDVQDRINRLIAEVLRYPVHAAVKVLLAACGIDCGHCIAPRRRLSAGEEAQLCRALAATELGHELLGDLVRA